MRIRIKHIFLLVITLVAFANVASPQIPDEIILSLKTGNAAKLSSHFKDNVELVILDSENVYSKVQAQQILADFFKKYPPQNFVIIHQGGKDGLKFTIGNLQVPNEKFRVYFLVNSKSGTLYIHQLRIERQNN